MAPSRTLDSTQKLTQFVERIMSLSLDYNGKENLDEDIGSAGFFGLLMHDQLTEEEKQNYASFVNVIMDLANANNSVQESKNGTSVREMRSLVYCLSHLMQLSKKMSEDAAKDVEKPVSIKSHTILHVAVELISSWGLFPLLFCYTTAFGELERSKVVNNISAGEKAKAKWFSIRTPSKTLKLDASILWRALPIYCRTFDKKCANLMASSFENILNQFYGVLFTSCTCPQYAAFLMEKVSVDIFYIFVYLQDKEAIDSLKAKMGTQIAVASLLKLTQFQSEVMHMGIFTKEKIEKDTAGTDTATVMRRNIGAFLSSFVSSPGGLNVVLNEMIGHVPQGNVQAFIKVADLLTKLPRNDPKSYFDSVSRQTVALIRFTHSNGNEKINLMDPTTIPRLRRAGALIVSKLAERSQNQTYKPFIEIRQNILLPLLMPKLETNDVVTHEQLLQLNSYLYGLMDAAPPSPELITELALFLSNSVEMFIFASHNRCRGSGEAKSSVLLWLSKSSLETASELLLNVVWKSTPCGTLVNTLGQDYLQLYQTQDGGLIAKLFSKEEDYNNDNSASDVKLFGIQTRPTITDTIKLEPADLISKSVAEKHQPNAILVEDDIPVDDTEKTHSSIRVIFVRKIILACKNEDLLCSFFVHALDSISYVMQTECSLDADSLRRFSINIQVLQELTQDICGVVTSKIYDDIQRKEILVRGISTLLESCCSVLGLWTFEQNSDAGSSLHDSRNILQQSTHEKAPAGLVVAPICLALASALCSCEVESSKDDLRWRTCIKAFLPSLAALSRADYNTALLGSGNITSPVAVKQAQSICTEISESAIAIRMSIFMRNRKAHVHSRNSLRRSATQKCEFDSSENGNNVDSPIISIDPIGNLITEYQKETKDQEPPIRAMGIDHLRDLLVPTSGDSIGSMNSISISSNVKPSQNHQRKIIGTLIGLLSDEDPYVYLSCVRALAAISSVYTSEMVNELSGLYTNSDEDMEFRLRIGEVLMLTVRRCGEMLPKYADRFIDIFLWGASVRRQSTEKKLSGNVDNEGRYIATRMRSKESEDSTDDFELALDVRFRTSSMSNLADTIGLAPWAAIKSSHDILSLVQGILTLERNGSIDIRRAAVFALYKLLLGLKGMSNNDAIYNAPIELKEVMSLLRTTMDYDPDALVVQHSINALEVADDMMQSYLQAYNDKGKKKELKVSLFLDRL